MSALWVEADEEEVLREDRWDRLLHWLLLLPRSWWEAKPLGIREHLLCEYHRQGCPGASGRWTETLELWIGSSLPVS